MRLIKLHTPENNFHEQRPVLVNPSTITYIERHHETGSYIHFNVPGDNNSMKYIHVTESLETIERLINC